MFDEDKRPIVLFDGVCNFCNANVNLLLDWDTKGKFRFASLQSKVGKAILAREGRDINDMSTMILADESKIYDQSDAVL